MAFEKPRLMLVLHADCATASNTVRVTVGYVTLLTDKVRPVIMASRCAVGNTATRNGR